MKKNNGAILEVVSAIIVLVAICQGTAGADDRDYPNYVRITSGFYQPTGDLDDADYDSGGDVSVFFGRYMGRHLVLEAGAGFFYTEKDSVGSTAAAGFFIEEDNIGVLALSATAKGVYPIGRVELFGGAGIGGYFVNLDAEITSSRLGNVDTDDDDAVFGFHVVGGAHYKITERFLLGGEVKYLWTDDVDIREPIADIPVRLQGNLNGYTASITFAFRF